MPKFQVMDNIAFDKKKFADCQDIIEKVRAGLPGLKKEKLRGYKNIRSLRYNNKIRVLYTKRMIEGKSRPVLLDVLYEHRYKKSSVTRSKTNKLFEYDVTNISFDENDFEEVDSDSDDEFRDDGTPVSYEKVSWYNNTIYQLQEEQGKIVNVKGTGIFTGPAGTGKTLIAFELLKEMLRSNVDAMVVYVTCSGELTKWMKINLAAQGFSERVRCLTVEELLTEMTSSFSDKKVVGREEFNEWLKEHFSKKQHAKIKSTLTRTADLFEELGIAAVCRNKEEYKCLGEHESLFSDAEQRECIWRLHESYKKYREDQNQVQVSMNGFEANGKVYGCVVDETQAIPRTVLRFLNSLAENNNIYYFMDPHQVSENKIPNIKCLRKMWKQRKIKVTEHKLSTTFRCPLLISKVVNAVLAVENIVNGGVQEKEVYAQVKPAAENDNPGSVEWWDELTPERKAELKNLAVAVNFAVITRSDRVKFWMEALNMHQVFTPTDARGLEFDIVFCDGLLEEDKFSLANGKLCKKLQDNAELIINENLPKNMHSEELITDFADIYMAYSRAKCRLIISDESSRKTKAIIDFIRGSINKAVAQNTNVVLRVNEEDLNDQIRKLIFSGKTDLAREMYQAKTGKSVDSFENEFGLLDDEELQQQQQQQPPPPPTVSSQSIDVKGKGKGKKNKDKFTHPAAIEMADILTDIEMIRPLVLQPTKKTIHAILALKSAEKILFDEAVARFIGIESKSVFIYLLGIKEVVLSVCEALPLAPQVFECMPIDQLCYKLKGKNFEICTPLYLLSLVLTAHRLLLQLYNKSIRGDRKILDQIVDIVFDEIVYDAAPVHSLSTTITGMQMMVDIFKLNPEYLNRITPNILFGIYHRGIFGDKLCGASLLYVYSGSDDGAEVLERSLIVCPELWRSPLFISALCNPLDDEKNMFCGATPLMMLAMNDRRITLLINLLHYSNGWKNVPISAFFLKITYKDNDQSGYTPFRYLIHAGNMGMVFLLRLYGECSEFKMYVDGSGLAPQAFFEKLRKNNDDLIAFEKMVRDYVPYLRGFVKSFSKTNVKNFLASKAAKKLLLEIPFDGNINLLSVILFNPEYREVFFAELVGCPNVLTMMSINELTEPYPLSGNKFASMSQLINWVAGCQGLPAYLYNNNSDFRVAFNTDLKSGSNPVNSLDSRWRFYAFSTSYAGLGLQHSILKLHPTIHGEVIQVFRIVTRIINFEFEALSDLASHPCANHMLFEIRLDKYDNIICLLLQNQTNVQWLNQISPDFILRVPLRQLLIPFEYGNHIGSSALKCLTIYIEGYEWLLKCMPLCRTARPELFDAIKSAIQSSCHFSPNHAALFALPSIKTTLVEPSEVLSLPLVTNG